MKWYKNGSVKMTKEELSEIVLKASETKHGKWINTHHGGIHGDTIYQCSCCGNEREAYIDEENYCCNCGAKWI